MSDDLLHQLETELLSALGAIDGVALVKQNEPQQLSPRQLPAVTLKWKGLRTVDYETGNAQDVAHTWRIYLYTEARDLEQAQEALKIHGVKIARALRDDPTLNGLADFTSLVTEEEPDIVKRGTQQIGQMTFLFSATGVDNF